MYDEFLCENHSKNLVPYVGRWRKGKKWERHMNDTILTHQHWLHQWTSEWIDKKGHAPIREQLSGQNKHLLGGTKEGGSVWCVCVTSGSKINSSWQNIIIAFILPNFHYQTRYCGNHVVCERWGTWDWKSKPLTELPRLIIETYKGDNCFMMATHISSSPASLFQCESGNTTWVFLEERLLGKAYVYTADVTPREPMGWKKCCHLLIHTKQG